jgi:hypothetical protein
VQICLQPSDLCLRPWQDEQSSGLTDALEAGTALELDRAIKEGCVSEAGNAVANATAVKDDEVIQADKDVKPFEDNTAIEVSVLSREFLGRDWLYQVRLGELRLRVRQPLSPALERGQRCRLALMAGAEPLLFPLGWPLRARPAQSPWRA